MIESATQGKLYTSFDLGIVTPQADSAVTINDEIEAQTASEDEVCS